MYYAFMIELEHPDYPYPRKVKKNWENLSFYTSLYLFSVSTIKEVQRNELH